MIVTEDENSFIKDYFDYYFHGLKVGLCIAIAPSDYKEELKSGVGKSYTALKFGEILDPDFNLDKVIFEPQDFVRAMRILEDSGKAGQVIVIDEAGILVNSRKWFSLVNRGISDAIMTFRNLRCLAIFVTPEIDTMDKNIRMYISHKITTKKILRQNRTRVNINMFKLFWTSQSNKPYKQRVKVFMKKHDGVVPIKNFRLGLPSEKITIPYEKKMKIYKRKIRAQVFDIAEQDMPVSYYVNEILDKDSDLIEKDTKTGMNKVYSYDIKEEFNIPQRKADRIASKINDFFKEEFEEVSEQVKVEVDKVVNKEA